MPDINLTITIPDGKVAEVRTGILAYRPLEPGQTEIELLQQIAQEGVQRAYRKGKYMLAADTVVLEDIFTVTT